MLDCGLHHYICYTVQYIPMPGIRCSRCLLAQTAPYAHYVWSQDAIHPTFISAHGQPNTQHIVGDDQLGYNIL